MNHQLSIIQLKINILNEENTFFQHTFNGAGFSLFAQKQPTNRAALPSVNSWFHWQSAQNPMPTGDVRKQAPAAGDAPKIQIGKAETFKLENGLTVIVVENHKLPKVSYPGFCRQRPGAGKRCSRLPRNHGRNARQRVQKFARKLKSTRKLTLSAHRSIPVPMA